MDHQPLVLHNDLSLGGNVSLAEAGYGGTTFKSSSISSVRSSSADTLTPTAGLQLRTVEEEKQLSESAKDIEGHASKRGWSRKSPNKYYILLHNLIPPFIVIATAAAFAWYFEYPFIFPSLGPTAFLHFAIPNKPPSSPRNTMIGHLIGILAGFGSLNITNLYLEPSVFTDGVTINRIWCSALSVAVTCFLMIFFNAEHPPAGATTLIVSLGIIQEPIDLSIMMAAVLLITIQAFIINRIFRLDAIYPFWDVPQPKPGEEMMDKKDSMMRLRGYSKMRLSRMNIFQTKFNKLNNMMNVLTVDNWMEYYEICGDLESDGDMMKLVEFAKINKDKLNQIREFRKEVPYSTRVVINSSDDHHQHHVAV